MPQPRAPRRRLRRPRLPRRRAARGARARSQARAAARQVLLGGRDAQRWGHAPSAVPRPTRLLAALLLAVALGHRRAVHGDPRRELSGAARARQVAAPAQALSPRGGRPPKASPSSAAIGRRGSAQPSATAAAAPRSSASRSNTLPPSSGCVAAARREAGRARLAQAPRDRRAGELGLAGEVLPGAPAAAKLRVGAVTCSRRRIVLERRRAARTARPASASACRASPAGAEARRAQQPRREQMQRVLGAASGEIARLALFSLREPHAQGSRASRAPSAEREGVQAPPRHRAAGFCEDGREPVVGALEQFEHRQCVGLVAGPRGAPRSGPRRLCPGHAASAAR